jgi:hypothetical protein
MGAVPTDDTAQPNPTPRYRALLRLAQDQARRHGHHHLDVEHLMLAILEEGRSVTAQVLNRHGDLRTLRNEIERVLTSESDQHPPGPRRSEDDGTQTDSVEVTLVRRDERQRATLYWAWLAGSAPDEAYRARLEWSGPSIEVAAGDLFEALVRIRAQLEPQGWLIAVQGSCRDAYPSAMQRDMAGGLNVYVVRPGEPARLDNVVEILAEAEPDRLATVAAQRAFIEEWSRSLRAVPSDR